MHANIYEQKYRRTTAVICMHMSLANTHTHTYNVVHEQLLVFWTK